MNSELQELVTDTLTYLRQEGHLCLKKPVPTIPAPKARPVLQQEPPKGKTTPQVNSSIHEAIRKHLPHIRLEEKIPQENFVTIVVFEKENLPFLKNLALAIQNRFCKVKLLDGTLEKTQAQLHGAKLVISQRELPQKADIVLDSISLYENNTEQKKQLWSLICKKLSPLSS